MRMYCGSGAQVQLNQVPCGAGSQGLTWRLHWGKMHFQTHIFLVRWSNWVPQFLAGCQLRTTLFPCHMALSMGTSHRAAGPFRASRGECLLPKSEVGSYVRSSHTSPHCCCILCACKHVLAPEHTQGVGPPSIYLTRSVSQIIEQACAIMLFSVG